MPSFFAIYKPFGMLSQFSKEGDHKTLADLGFAFSKEVYPVGRLDSDSEGLLLLTDQRTLTARILDPEKGHEREYWAQVEGEITNDAIKMLEKGVVLRIDGREFKTQPSKVHVITQPDALPERIPPVRFRKSIPTSWISISLHEGKNRQVRRMTASVGFPTLRLIRVRIGKLSMPSWEPGSVTELSAEKFLLAAR